MVRATRRSKAKRGGTRRSNATRRMRGGSKHEKCLAVLKKVIVDDYEYERMVDYGSEAIDVGQSYDDFVEHNEAAVDHLSEEECDLFLNLCDKIKNRKLSQMDMESCAVFETNNLFFDKKGKMVLVNPR